MTSNKMTCDLCGRELDQHKDRYVVRFQSVPLYRDTNHEAYDLCLECASSLRERFLARRKSDARADS